MDIQRYAGADVHPKSTKMIYVNPPETGDDDPIARMDAFLRFAGKTAEQFEEEVVAKIVELAQSHQEDIAAVLLSAQDRELKVIFGVICGILSDFTDTVTDLEWNLAERGWPVSALEFPSGDVAQLIDFSHFDMD